MSKDALVSTKAVREGMDRVEEEIDKQKRLRPEWDPFFVHVAWVLEEVRAAVREAEREYRPTSEAAKLTGWSTETLRRRARELHDGEAVPGEWAQMIVRRDGADWSFLLPSVPVKRSNAA